MKLMLATLTGNYEFDSDFILEVKHFGVNQTIIEYEDDQEHLSKVVLGDYHEIKKIVDAAQK